MVPDLRGDRDRQKFVIKVYSLIMIMLIVTSAWSVIVYTDISMLLFVYSNIYLWYIAAILSIVIMCGIICKHEKFRAVPINYIALSIYTVCHAYMIGGILP